MMFEKLLSGRDPESLSSSCAEVTGCRGGCPCVCRRAPWGHPAPPLGCSGCPSQLLRTAAGRLVVTYPALVGPVRFKPAAPTLTQTPSPPPFPQGYSHSSSSKTLWSPLLVGGYHSFSRLAPAGHSGLLPILVSSIQLSVFRGWGPWVLDQIGWELCSGGPGGAPAGNTDWGGKAPGVGLGREGARLRRASHQVGVGRV